MATTRIEGTPSRITYVYHLGQQPPEYAEQLRRAFVDGDLVLLDERLVSITGMNYSQGKGFGTLTVEVNVLNREDLEAIRKLHQDAHPATPQGR